MNGIKRAPSFETSINLLSFIHFGLIKFDNYYAS